jgi:hypothetical protein
MKEICDEKKKGWSFIDDGKGTTVIKKRRKWLNEARGIFTKDLQLQSWS